MDLSHLSEDQRQQLQQMLREECEFFFAKGEWGTGCIKDLEMGIQLKDIVPVQRTYNTISVRKLENTYRTYYTEAGSTSPVYRLQSTEWENTA